MLRESSRVAGNTVDLGVLTSGTKVQGGVDAEVELVEFAEAALGDDVAAIATARDRVEGAVGTEGMVDAAGVVANFQRMVRIADGTGIPLDDAVAMITADERGRLGINDFSSAKNTPALSAMKRLFAPLITKLLPLVFRRRAKG
jgi:hypothetical protein